MTHIIRISGFIVSLNILILNVMFLTHAPQKLDAQQCLAAPWPAGPYCILQGTPGGCPVGFLGSSNTALPFEGRFCMDVEDHHNLSNYGTNIGASHPGGCGGSFTFELCCKS